MKTNDQFKHVEEYDHIISQRKGHGLYGEDKDQLSDDLQNMSFDEMKKREHELNRDDSEQSLRYKNVILNNMTPNIK